MKLAPGNITGNLIVSGSVTAGSFSDGSGGGSPIGSLIVNGTGPSSSTNYGASATVFSLSVPVVAGCTYALIGGALGTMNTAAAIVTVTVSSDDGVLSSARVISETTSAANEHMGERTLIYTPATTRTTVFTMTAQTSGGGATWTIGANAAWMIATRVA